MNALGSPGQIQIACHSDLLRYDLMQLDIFMVFDHGTHPADEMVRKRLSVYLPTCKRSYSDAASGLQDP